jgi:hypothetical protein
MSETTKDFCRCEMVSTSSRRMQDGLTPLVISPRYDVCVVDGDGYREVQADESGSSFTELAVSFLNEAG